MLLRYSFISYDFYALVFQPKPQFQSLFKAGQTSSASSSASSTSQPVVQPPSYAEFIVQNKNNAAAPVQGVGPSKQPGPEGPRGTNLKQNEPAPVSSALVQHPEAGSKREETQVVGTKQHEGDCQRPEPDLSLGPKPVGSGSSIIVSPRQVWLQSICLMTCAAVGQTF